MTDNDRRVTWVLVDGENIDATLGTSILGRRPQPDERPRWDRLTTFAERVWSQPAREFLNLGFSTLVGLEKFDLEYDARVFDAPLPRIRIIPIDEFDPNTFLA
jgi:hypothetical protein